MKKFTRFIAAVLAVIMLTTVLPIGAFALSDTKVATKLEIVDNPFKYIENDLDTYYTYEDEDGNLVEGYDAYSSFYELKLKITYEDGSTEMFCYGEYDGEEDAAAPDIIEEHWEPMAWTVGGDNYYTVAYQDLTIDVPVTVEETPVEKIEIIGNTFRFIEGDPSSCYFDEETGEYYYRPDQAMFGLTLKVTYKNGDVTSFEPRIDDLTYEDLFGDKEPTAEELLMLVLVLATASVHDGSNVHFLDDQDVTPWKVNGNNSYTVSFKGYELEVPAYVVNSNIESVNILENSFKYVKEDQTYGQWMYGIDEEQVFVYNTMYSLIGLKLQINYDDGKSEVICVRDYDVIEFLYIILYTLYYYAEDDQLIDAWAPGGENIYTLYYRGTPVDVPVHIIDPNATDVTKKFKDVKDGKWYTEYVDYAVNYGLFNGTSDNTFEPNAAMNRAMFVQVLANLAGAVTDRQADTGFKDVPKGKWYTGAVDWAAENEIVNGSSPTTFEPMKDVTRQEMCTMIGRFTIYMGVGMDTDKVAKKTFTDDKKISTWAKDYVTACQTAGLIDGMPDGSFDPRASATRAQVAKILSVYHELYFM